MIGNYANITKRIKFYFYNLKELFFHKTDDEEIELIKNSKLFIGLDSEGFQELLKSISLVYNYADELILKKGSIGDALYIVADGSVRVFDYSQEGKKNPLARLNKGSYFGEQALLGQYGKTRNANIEAIADTVLIKIDEKYILSLLKIDKDLEDRLKKIGNQQILNNIASTIDVYESIIPYLEKDAEKSIYKMHKDEVIFNAGDSSEYVYLIIDGKVRIEMPNGVKIFLEKQQLFGEVGALYDKPRAASAIAEENSTLARIEAKEFKQITQENPSLQQLLKSLGNAYTLSNNRGVVQQYFGKAMGMNTITSVFDLMDGRKAIAANAIEKKFFVMEVQSSPKERKRYVYRKDENLKVELDVVDKYILAIRCYGSWDDLPLACSALLEKKSVPTHLLERFKSSGVFNLEIAAPTAVREIICECMGVKKQTIDDLINEGVRSLAQISSRTGACTVCGSCRTRILTMLNQNVWVPALMSKVKVFNENVASFQLQPTLGSLANYLPGQHVVIQVRIGEMWVERAYTITDLLEGNKLCITIKREKKGFFTQWLFNNLIEVLPIYVSQPQGNFTLKVDSNKSILCFAGGIGITPFVAFAKAFQNFATSNSLHIVYIASTKNDFIFVDELEEVLRKNDKVSLTLWEKKSEGMITKEKINTLLENQPSVYICGPEGWETSIVESLKSLDYSDDKIFIEKFTYVNPIIFDD